MNAITDLTACAAREGFTHGTWQGKVHTLDDINGILRDQDVAGHACSWRGWEARVPSLTTTVDVEPTREEVERAGGVGTVAISRSLDPDTMTARTTWIVTPMIRFDLANHPSADPLVADERIAAARAAIPATLTRAEYERLCAVYGCDPESDDDVIRWGSSTMVADHSADPTGRRRIGTILLRCRYADINPSEPDLSHLVTVLGAPRGGLNSQDQLAALIGVPTPTQATLRDECHFCGLPLLNGECEECR